MVNELINTMDYIEYGILAAIVLAGLMLFLLAIANSRKQLNILSYMIALVLLIPLSYQMSRFIGACELLSTANAVNDFVGSISLKLKEYTVSMTTHEINWFIFRRVLWSVVFMVISGVGIWITMAPKRKKYHATFDDYDSTVSSSTDEWGL